MKLLSLLILFTACSIKGHEPSAYVVKGEVRYYEDINMFLLEGQREMKRNDPCPRIRIESFGDSVKNITFFETDSGSYTSRYKRSGDYWVYNDTSNGDTCILIKIGYISPDKIVEFGYYTNGTTKDPLMQYFSITRRDQKRIYHFSNSFRFPPDTAKIDLLKSKCSSVSLMQIVKNNGALTIDLVEKDTSGIVIFRNKRCYEVGDHSYFWWERFEPYAKAVHCP